LEKLTKSWDITDMHDDHKSTVHVHTGLTRCEGFTVHVDYDLKQVTGLTGVFVDMEGKRLCCVLEYDKHSTFPYIPKEVWSRVIEMLHR